MSPNERHNTKQKVQDIDWEALRARSLERGGFGDDRVELWPRLLNVKKEKLSSVEDEKSLLDEQTAHKDERQIGLDTDRSFVLYPVEPKIDRETLQADLHKLLVSLFRKRPRLSYFQGYHDIVTVLFLTLPEELRLACVEKLSLHRLRDSMGDGLEPVLGLLRVTRNLLRLADPDFAEVLERNSPLPFYALSNLLTLFSHDVPTLPLIQHVFDFLLSRPPIAAVYLATAIILSRKKEVLRLEEEEEDGMIHSLLSSFPNLVDDVQDLELAEDSIHLPKSEDSLDDSRNTFFKDEQDTQLHRFPQTPEAPDADNTATPPETVERHHVSGNHIEDSESPQIPPPDAPDGSTRPPRKEGSNECLHRGIPHSEPSHPADQPSSPLSNNDVQVPNLNDNMRGSLGALSSSSEEGRRMLQNDEQPETHPGGAEVQNAVSVKTEEHDAVENPLSSEATLSEPPPITVEHDDPWLAQPTVPPPRLILTDLLRHADELYKEFPPSHSGLSLSSIMGPQSVIFTWSESPSKLPSDNMAEAMVTRPELVVYPYVEEAENTNDEDDTQSSSEDEKGKGKEKAKASKGRRPWKRRDSKSKSAGGKSHRKRRKLRKSPFAQMERRTMVAGTVLVLGVAMAVYGIKTRNANGLPLFGVHEGRAAAGAGVAVGAGSAKDLKKFGGWLGGALVGMTEKIMTGLGSSGGGVARPS